MKPPRRVTLRLRLTLLYGGLFLAAGMLLLGVTYVLFQQQIQPEGTLDGGLVIAPSTNPSNVDARDSATQVVGSDGKVLTGAKAEEWIEEQEEILRDAAATTLLAQGGIALGVVGGVAMGLGWLIAGRALAPLHRVTDTAQRIAAAPAADRGLHERIALRGPDDEVKELADTFDIMLQRLDQSFDGQRRFIANASHELRTPLTLGRALVELAMHRESAPQEVKQLGEDLLRINSRHERLISGLLLLATTENAVMEHQPVDLADVVAHVVAQIAPESNAAGVTVHQDAAEAPTTGDVLLLERLVHNLVENGIRHNSGDDRQVWITTRRRNNTQVEVRVSNTGEAVPPYEIPALFEPFHRLAADRLVTAKGAGLGMSIIQSVARIHNGESVAEPRSGGGLVVTVTLPANTEPSPPVDTPSQ